MRGRLRFWQGAALATLLLSPPTLAQQQAPAAPPERMGPTWDGRHHPPNPAEVEARSRALGLPQPREDREAREVDQLYRDLTGSNPQAPPRATSRDADRR